MNNFYCTIVDRNYVLRGLTLYNSFIPSIENKTFGFFCIDEKAVEMLKELKLKNAWIVGPEEFETAELLAVKKTRAINEYCWTCKPAVLLYAAQRDPSFDWLIYLDSDMMAFADPDLGLNLEDDVHVNLTLHNPSNRYFAEMIPTVGTCNAGYAAFRNSQTGLAASQWWLGQCLQSCPKVPSENAYADQKYFDDIADVFEGVNYTSLIGLNAGPWNSLTAEVREKEGQVTIDGQPLILYHFQGLKAYSPSFFDLYTASIKIPTDLKKYVFMKYVREMRKAYTQIEHHYQNDQIKFDPKPFDIRRTLSEVKRYILAKSNLVRL